MYKWECACGRDEVEMWRHEGLWVDKWEMGDMKWRCKQCMRVVWSIHTKKTNKQKKKQKQNKQKQQKKSQKTKQNKTKQQQQKGVTNNPFPPPTPKLTNYNLSYHFALQYMHIGVSYYTISPLLCVPVSHRPTSACCLVA